MTVPTLHSSKTSLYIDETAFCVDDQVSASIHKLYIRFFNCWCCNPEILYALLPIFWGLGIPYWSIPIFVILRKQIPISFTQSQHFLIFFIFLHGRDCVDCLLPSKLLLFWWQLCYVMLCILYLKSTHKISL